MKNHSVRSTDKRAQQLNIASRCKETEKEQSLRMKKKTAPLPTTVFGKNESNPIANRRRKKVREIFCPFLIS